jgi:hypothetical protein
MDMDGHTKDSKLTQNNSSPNTAWSSIYHFITAESSEGRKAPLIIGLGKVQSFTTWSLPSKLAEGQHQQDRGNQTGQLCDRLGASSKSPKPCRVHHAA